MIHVAVAGASGKLGSMVCELVRSKENMKLVAALVSPQSARLGLEIFPGVKAMSPLDLEDSIRGADVYVDLTSPSAARDNLPRIPPLGVNCVVGTTSIPASTVQEFTKGVKENGTSAVLSPNFSVGVNVFWKTCGDLANVLQGYDVEIVEIHHNQKKDAPSGTAMRAAEIIARRTGIEEMVHGRKGDVGARKKEIGIHAVRAGDVVGEHTVIFAGKRERIELTHRAHSRQAFAEGCITAIEWVNGRKDGMVHGMDEVLGL